MAAANPEKNLHEVYDKVSCPKCLCSDKSKVKTTIFGRGAFIRICSVCDWSIGVDDSANLCYLGTKRWMFEVTDDSVDKSCLKNHRHAPLFIGLNAESLMQSICNNCRKTGIMFTVEGSTDDDSDTDAPICDVSEILQNIFETGLQENSTGQLSSPISDDIQNEIKSVVDQRSDELIAILLSIDYAEQTNSLLVCQCGREECSECSSDLFARTPQSSATEQSNGKLNPTIDSEENAPVKARVRVTNLKQLQRADHIAWDRCYAVWHHAIVKFVDTNRQEIIVIHNSGGLKDNQGKMASVRTETVKVDCATDFLYVYQYSEEECYPPDEVIERALESLGTTYNILTYNCEHFARWCKTGMKYCLQMEGFSQRLKMGSSGLVKFVEEWVLVALRVFGNSETMKQILATGAKGARAAIKIRLGGEAGSATLFRNLGIGTMVGSIALAVATEVIFFIWKTYKAKKEVEKGDMPWDEFQRLIVQLIFEGLFGLGGGLAVGFGISLIPYVGVFLSPLGYIIGNWILRLLGAIVGRFIARRLPGLKPMLCSS